MRPDPAPSALGIRPANTSHVLYTGHNPPGTVRIHSRTA